MACDLWTLFSRSYKLRVPSGFALLERLMKQARVDRTRGYESDPKDDQITRGHGAGGRADCPKGLARLVPSFLPQDLHPTTVARHSPPAAVLRDWLPRHGAPTPGLWQPVAGSGLEESITPLDVVPCRETAEKKGFGQSARRPLSPRPRPASAEESAPGGGGRHQLGDAARQPTIHPLDQETPSFGVPDPN